MTPEQLAFPDMPEREATGVPEWMTVVSRIFSSRKSRSVMKVISGIKRRYDTLPLAISFADGERWTGIPNEILDAHRQHGLTPSEHCVLVFLYQKCWYMRPGRDPEPTAISFDGFAVATGLDRRTVRRAIAGLEELCIIRVIHRGRGRGVMNMYLISPAVEWKKKPEKKGDEIAPFSIVRPARESRKGVRIAH